MPQGDPLVDRLLQWAQEHLSSVLNVDVEIYNDPLTGLSFRALKNLSPESIVVSCPYAISLSYLNAIESSPFRCHGSKDLPRTLGEPHVISNFFLMQQYLLGSKSFWHPYICSLPQPDEPHRLGIPLWWSEEDQSFLIGTNAEPPLRERKMLWTAEHRRGIKVLKDGSKIPDDMNKYTYDLYQWAATIFGTRSFRASLTIPGHLVGHDEEVQNHVQHDRFSVLLPVVDVGNHSAINNMNWSSGAVSFDLVSRSSVAQGSQIYNFYGVKSNSELLIGYGFIIPDDENDRVNIKLKVSPEALSLRRLQSCYHPCSREKADIDEFMFYVRNTPKIVSGSLAKDSANNVFSVFSEGLIDMLACMLANERERRFLVQHPDYCFEQNKNMFDGNPMSRLALHVLCVLQDKLEIDTARIVESGASLSVPRSSNQRLAFAYRNRQLSVLRRALTKVKFYLSTVVSARSNSITSQSENSNYHTAQASDARPGASAIIYSGLRSALEHQLSEPLLFLTLSQAYAILASYSPSISQQIELLISQDQEEEIPLNWGVLATEGWDFTYWAIWVYIMCLICIQDDPDLRMRYGMLVAWIRKMLKQSAGPPTNLFHSSNHIAVGAAEVDDIAAYAEDPSEVSTISQMIAAIHGFPEFDTHLMKTALKEDDRMRAVRATAGRVAREETLCLPHTGASLGTVLCVWQARF